MQTTPQSLNAVTAPRLLPCAPSAQEVSHNMGYFMTRTGSFKSYEQTIIDGKLLFRRPKSSKNLEFSYKLNTIQCLIRNKQVETPTANRGETMTEEFCINLISSST